MDILRKILYALIGVLVIVVAAGGGYLALTGGHGSNHGTNQQQTAQNQQAAEQNKPQTNAANGQQNQTPEAPAQQPQNPDAQAQQSQNPAAPGQQSGTQGQQPQAGSTNSQPPAQAPPILYPAAPPVRTIDPDPYYDRLNKAREVIEEANKMMTVDPFTDSGSKDPAAGGADMSKLHQGIYKMSQGMTVMQETLDTLNKEIKGDARFAPSPNQPANPGYYPYQGYYQPNAAYGYNPQYPYNQIPGTPNQQQPQPGQSQPGSQTDPNQANQQLHQPTGNQPLNHGTDTTSLLGSLSGKKLMTYIAYGILAASIIGVFVAILGMVNSIFKKPNSSQS